VKLPRQLLDWKHIKNINAVYLYAYLLLSADRETGSVRVSIRGLADMTGLSVQNVRTILNLLEREGMVTRELTHQVTQQLTQGTSVITICDLVDYDASESDSQHSNQHSAQHSNQHTLQKGFSPTPPFLKNKQEINNNININSACAKDKFAEEVNTCYAKQEQALMSLGMRPDELPKFLAIAKDIMTEWELTNSDDWTWRHLINHARIKIKNDGSQRKTNDTAADASPDAFTRYFAAKEFERRSKEGAGHVS
jgi:DNA-binding IscR family transcriptional regulator